MAETMTYNEYLTLVATAMIEQEDFGRMRPATKEKVQKIKYGEITVLDEGEVPPLEDLT